MCLVDEVVEVVVGGTTIVVDVVVGGTITVVDVVVDGTTGGVLVVVPLMGVPGRPGMPRQAPKLDWQPGPQNSMEEPHQKYWEQQGP